MSGLLIFLILLLIWISAIYIFRNKESDSFSLWGPIVMWKTEKGKKLIERISKKEKFWKGYADFGIALSLFAMFATFALIIYNAYLSFLIPPENAPSPQMMIGLPGINPVIPLGYGILALAVAIIIHEFSHGILAMVGKIKVNALGLIFLIVPIGAFVEPDEEELEKVSRRKRSRVFAAGPTSNMFLAFVCAILFSSVMMGMISPKVNGVMISGEVEGSPFDIAGINPWSAITSFDGVEIKSIDDFNNIVKNIEPGKKFNATIFYEGRFFNASIVSGLVISNVVKDYPAYSAGLEVGDVLLRINGTEITPKTFSQVMNGTGAGDTINVEFLRYENGKMENHSVFVTLADKYDYYREYNPDANKEEYRGKGFLGISTLPMGITALPMDYYRNRLMHPLSDRHSFFFYIALPFAGFSPFPEAFTSLFSTPFSPSVFWPLTNTLYWLFWLNFAIGTFNVLPAIPLDGGYIFRDGVSFLTSKIKRKWKDEKVKKVSSAVTTIFSFAVLFVIISIILIPRLRAIL